MPKSINELIYGYVGNPFIITLKVTDDIRIDIDGTWPNTTYGRNNMLNEIYRKNKIRKNLER